MSEASTEEKEEELLHGGKVMSIWDHLGELRQRIFYSAVVVLLFFAVAMSFAEYIVEFLKQPLMQALPEKHRNLHFTGPLDPFIVSIKVSFLVSVIGACPFWLLQFWKFIEPALYPKERRYVLPFALASAILFFVGTSFCYYFILPLALEFLIGLGLEIGTPIITITDYVSLLTILLLAFGIVFETPVILVLLAVLGLVEADDLSGQRSLIVIIIFIVAALMTPPDPMSQLGVAIPTYLMFEASIIIIRLMERSRSKADV